MNLNFSFDLLTPWRKNSVRSLLALDLRRTQICLCQVDRHGQPSLLERIPLDADQQVSREAVAELLEKVLKEKQLKGSRCITLLHRPDYALFQMDAPQVPRAEIAAALRWKVADQIDFPVSEAIIDFFDLPAGPGSETRQLYVVVARENVIQARVDLLRGLGLEPAYIDIADMAQRNLAARLSEDAQGVALLDMGDLESLLTITRDGELIFSRTLALGSAALVDNLIFLCGFSPDMARSVIEGQGWQESNDGAVPDTVQNAMRQGIERLALEIQRSMDYYDSRFRRGAIKHLYLSFDNMPVPGMADYLGTLTGLQCRNFPDIRMSKDHLITAKGCLLAYGAALRELLQ